MFMNFFFGHVNVPQANVMNVRSNVRFTYYVGLANNLHFTVRINIKWLIFINFIKNIPKKTFNSVYSNNNNVHRKAFFIFFVSLPYL